MGVQQVWVWRFDAALAALSAEKFIEEILCARLNIKHLIVGEDFRFGQGRVGDVALLKQAGECLGFTVEVMPGLQIEGQRVSSTRVRQALAASDHALAEQLLGHPYCLFGRVVYGNQLGRVLGFPTANIYLHRQETAVKGIYVVRLHGIASHGLPGVANVGTRPTIGGTRTLLEVHVFDFDQTIYGRQVKVEFCKKLRDEVRFDTLDLLKEQMLIDAEQARDYFKLLK
jgi:riboflavin kinase/FMN adenylyltransferase